MESVIIQIQGIIIVNHIINNLHIIRLVMLDQDKNKIENHADHIEENIILSRKHVKKLLLMK